MPLLSIFARACRDTRLAMDLSQTEVARAAGLSRGYYARVETAAANPTTVQLDAIAAALGLRLDVSPTRPLAAGPSGPLDEVHAACIVCVSRRLSRAGLLVVREVPIGPDGRGGWIDLLAFDPRSGILYVIEVKTRLDDLGAIDRQLARYEAGAWDAAARLGWTPRSITTWLLVLATAETDGVMRRHRGWFRSAFPTRAPAMLEAVGSGTVSTGRAVALIDPRSRARTWLVRTVLDGRRRPPPYPSAAAAAAALRSG